MARIVLEQGKDYVLRNGQSPELTNPIGLDRLHREASAGNEVVIEVDDHVLFRCPPVSSAG